VAATVTESEKLRTENRRKKFGKRKRWRKRLKRGRSKKGKQEIKKLLTRSDISLL
jgi:hypothetical protein